MLYLFAILMTNLHLIYHQATSKLDLFPLNNIRAYTTPENAGEAVMNFLSMGFPVIALLSGYQVLVLIACVELAIILIGEIYTWWTPYFFGPRFAMQKNWAELHRRLFSKTIFVLPNRKGNPAPNLEHLILHGLTFASFIACVACYVTW
ncbi:hypothetical protein [Chitinophaga sp. CB10]|uniref:hypothetical protein n=1 Tax=Chitinophaga sp. CB10 TaxID=1891659 RepID=UPI0025BA4231|nr:hypothetical protein [Chitinophaga sp. CB10]